MWAALVTIGLIVAATGVTALVAPPNNYDSMAYHMARVAHWAADATLAYYPTNIIRQLYEPPWLEYGILQLQILSSSDQFANLVQWFCMIGSVAGASLIAKRLGAPLWGQLMAAVVVVTLPMGILQATSTQTDYALTLWLSCAVLFAFEFASTPRWQSAFWFGASLGLAALTKGTAYIFAFPLILAVGVWMTVKLRKRLIRPAVLMIAIPLLINSGQYARNEMLFGNPLAPQSESAGYANAMFSPGVAVSNLLRDSVLQFGTPFPSVNNLMQRGIARVHSQLLHLDLSDPRTTWVDTTFAVNATSLDEDYAGDPLQALLAIAAMVGAIAIALRRGPPLLGVYGGGLILAFLLFAAYLKWQPWLSRLELPLLVLGAPLIGAMLPRVTSAAGGGVIAAVLIVACVPWVIDNASRPMVGFEIPHTARYLQPGQTIFNTSRGSVYFAKRHELAGPYAEVAARAAQAGCTEIGLWTGPADWEYPLWVLAQTLSGRARVDQIMVANESIHSTQFGSTPCLLVVVVPDKPTTVDVNGVQFNRVLLENGVGLYEPA